ncbi:NADH:flavin oxidoreductase NADH oxidase family protein [Stachybotrys elegans]|uniref:NADH:flavin oxidoreductase NADH oxidase family protein n=1 Tax=Stachybotrys elegans TaxID=80388 RepID=A0A8K0WPA5_9HYPO|nr:NADH:flavin oxidoreductase NADH oxidase family protein [Stachybotrys elegans]
MPSADPMPEPFQAKARDVCAPAESRLFKPLKVGNMLLQNRVPMAPLTRMRSDEEHTPLDFMAKYYGDRASVPGTLIISEATAISHNEEGQPNIPGLVSDPQAEAWRKIIEAVHAKGSFFFQQIWGVGRAAQADYVAKRGFPYRSSSNVPMDDGEAAVNPRAMTEEEIQGTIQAFVDTAKRAVAAGADGVEIHSAHGYLLDQFLSDKINTRTDKWGGSIENRARLPLEVIRQVAAAIGAERTAMRFSPFAGFQGSEKGDAQELYTYLIEELKKMNLKFAYLSLVEATGDPGALIFGGKQHNLGKTLDFILEAWDNTSPVMVAGGYKPQSAVWAVEEHYKKWDVMVAFGRLFLANPDFVYRLQHGIEFNKYNRSTFYLVMQEEGYNDYPFSEVFLQERGKASP